MVLVKYSKLKFCVGIIGLLSCAGLISCSLDMAANEGNEGNGVSNGGFCATRKLPS